MKGILYRTAPVLCTLLIFAAGAYMPQLVSLAVDHRMEEQVVQREDMHVSLVLSQTGDLFQTLDLFDARQPQIKLAEGYRMSAEEAAYAAAEVADKINGAGIGPEMEKTYGSDQAYSFSEITPVLIANKEDPSLSGVFWRCTRTEDPGGFMTLWLDDRSGKMVAFQGSLRSVGAAKNTWEDVGSVAVYNFYSPDDVAEDIAEFCRDYYPVANVGVQSDAQNGSYSDYTLMLLGKNGDATDMYSVSLRMRGVYVNFNL